MKQEHAIIVSGRSVFYWEQNPMEKEVIILLHGFPGNHQGLISLADSLNGYRVIVPDLAACGRSEMMEGRHTLENYARWLDDFLDQIGVDQAFIVGHSFGSRVALMFALHYPARTKKLILITPVLKVDGLIAYFLSLHCNIAKLLPEYMRRDWLSNKLYRKLSNIIIFKSPDLALRKEIEERDRKEFKQLDYRVAMDIFEEFYRSSLIEVSRDVKVPTFVIGAGKDEIVSAESLKEFTQGIPDASIEFVDHAGHLLPLEDPSTTARVIARSLK